MGKKKGGGSGARFATDPKKRERERGRKERKREKERARIYVEVCVRVIPRTDGRPDERSVP